MAPRSSFETAKMIQEEDRNSLSRAKKQVDKFSDRRCICFLLSVERRQSWERLGRSTSKTDRLFRHSPLPKIASPSRTHFNHFHARVLLSITSAILSKRTSKESIGRRLSSFSWNSLIKEFTASRRFLQTLFILKKLLVTTDTKPDCFTFPPLLKACSGLPAPGTGLGLHGYLIKCGFGSQTAIANSILSMYSKIGRTRDAALVLEEMPMRDGVSYNTMINGFGSNGFYEQVLMVFGQMLKSGFFPNMESVSHAIMACGELGCMSMGLLIHSFVIQNGFYSDISIINSLISMYVKAGRLEIGRHIFDDMQKRDLVSWNSMITGYARNGDWFEAVDLFLTMQKAESFTPSPVTFLGLVLACGQARNLYMGESVHGLLIHMGLLSDFRLGTSIVDMYSKCGRIDCARSIFDTDLSERSLVSWNSLIAGYSQNGCDYNAVLLFEQMLLETNVKPDSITIANVIPAYATFADLKSVSAVHTIVIKRGLELESDTVLGTAMVDAYGKCLDIESATSMFASVQKFNVATWNAMISGYNLNQQADRGISLFLEMLHSEVLPDSITMVMLFQSCGEFGSLKQGSMLHGHCLSRGFDSHITVGNVIIDMYMRFGCVNISEVLFNIMPSKNVVTCNTMLCGYVKNGRSALALKLFHQMQLDNHHEVDPVTMISIIQASTTISSGQGAEMTHGFALKLGFDLGTMVGNSLVDAYAKNGLIVNARSLFEQMGQSRDQSSWNVMIAGCGVNGQGEEACSLLFQMEEDGFQPNPITFISLLSSCSHSGLVKEGCRFFNLMVTKYGIQPSLEHWTCIIDMFGRAGRLEEAYQLIKYGFHCNLLSDCDAIWGALLSACRENMNTELGTLAAERLSRLAPQNCGYYTLLSNLYASVNRWDEAEKVRRVFDNGRLVKKPGVSMVMV